MTTIGPVGPPTPAFGRPRSASGRTAAILLSLEAMLTSQRPRDAARPPGGKGLGAGVGLCVGTALVALGQDAETAAVLVDGLPGLLPFLFAGLTLPRRESSLRPALAGVHMASSQKATAPLPWPSRRRGPAPEPSLPERHRRADDDTRLHLATLQRVGEAIAAGLERDDLLHAALRALATAHPFDEASVALADPRTGLLNVVLRTGAWRARLLPVGSRFLPAGPFLEQVAAGRTTLAPRDLTMGPHGSQEAAMAEAGLCVYIATALATHGHVNGIVLLASRRTTGFDERDGTLLRDVGRVLGPALALMPAPNRPAPGVAAGSDAGDEAVLVGRSAALQGVLAQVAQVAPTDAPVLVLGESGTGKELIARRVHIHSRRASGPLVTVSCAAIPRELFESEFFGHVRGAFTGAQRDRVGRFQLADGGTLFLDEIGELPLEMQAKLLRVLQEGRFERVGDERTRKVDVRLIAATNRDLWREAEAGRFRADLLYRLAVFPIRLAPLRARPDDIEPLTRHFLPRLARRHGLPVPELDDQALARLVAHPWPGNVRELENTLERAVIIAGGGRVDPSSSLGPATQAMPGGERVLTDAELRRKERDNLLAALRLAGGKVYGPGGAAELLGVPPTTFASRLRRLDTC